MNDLWQKIATKPCSTMLTEKNVAPIFRDDNQLTYASLLEKDIHCLKWPDFSWLWIYILNYLSHHQGMYQTNTAANIISNTALLFNVTTYTNTSRDIREMNGIDITYLRVCSYFSCWRWNIALFKSSWSEVNFSPASLMVRTALKYLSTIYRKLNTSVSLHTALST